MFNEAERKRVLKEVIKQLHDGLPPQEAKEKFKQVLEGISPSEIAKVEQELIEEGMRREEIQRLCDIHLEIFKERLEKQRFEVGTQNPIYVLMEEHKILLQLLEKLKVIVNDIQQGSDIDNDVKELENIMKVLSDADRHYLREENVLFPILERHGITEPPAIMWMEHDRIRKMKRKLKSLAENYSDGSLNEFQKQLGESARSLDNLLSSHIFKENNVLFPTALQLITQHEWDEAMVEFDEIGYCSFTPKHIILTHKGKISEEKISVEHAQEGAIQFETGMLSKEELEAILNRIPIDITFVDEKDTSINLREGSSSGQNLSSGEESSSVIRKRVFTLLIGSWTVSGVARRMLQSFG
ncbi:MAG: DUF438 domain-containing protein [Thermoproteota archaeon]